MNESVKLRLRQDQPDKRSKAALIIPVILIAAVGSGFFYLLRSKDSTNQSDSVQMEEPAVQGVTALDPTQKEYDFIDDGLGFSFRFRGMFTREDLTQDDKTAGFITRFTAEDPPMIVSVRKESGLKLPASMSRVDTATLLKNNIDKSLPQRYPGFELETSTTVTVNEKTAIERVFTYTGPSGALAKQRLLAILKDDDTAVYISMQTTATDYDSVNTTHFESLKTSIKFED